MRWVILFVATSFGFMGGAFLADWLALEGDIAFMVQAGMAVITAIFVWERLPKRDDS